MTEREELLGRHQAAKVFHDHASAYDDWFVGSQVYEIELAALRSVNAAMPEPMMEIGVGPGRFARHLGVAFGLDPARAPLLLAAQRGIKCCQGIGEELPVKDRALGTVYLLLTLCFVRDPQKVVAECGRILKDGGCLTIGMIPAASKWGVNLAAKKKAGHIFYKYANFFTVETVSRWLANSNMHVIEYRSTLYQTPGRTINNEACRNGPDEQAGFVVIVARKDHA